MKEYCPSSAENGIRMKEFLQDVQCGGEGQLLLPPTGPKWGEGNKDCIKSCDYAADLPVCSVPWHFEERSDEESVAFAGLAVIRNALASPSGVAKRRRGSE